MPTPPPPSSIFSPCCTSGLNPLPSGKSTSSRSSVLSFDRVLVPSPLSCTSSHSSLASLSTKFTDIGRLRKVFGLPSTFTCTNCPGLMSGIGSVSVSFISTFRSLSFSSSFTASSLFCFMIFLVDKLTSRQVDELVVVIFKSQTFLQI